MFSTETLLEVVAILDLAREWGLPNDLAAAAQLAATLRIDLDYECLDVALIRAAVVYRQKKKKNDFPMPLRWSAAIGRSSPRR